MGCSGVGQASESNQDEILAGLDSYFEQNIPLTINSTQTLDKTAANKPFIISDTRGAQGLISTDNSKVQKVFLCIVGLAVNTYAGSNALDCTPATHNLWRASLGSGPLTDLVNGSEPDGQMLDNDWLCHVEGANFGFSLMFDVTSLITAIDGNIGLTLENGMSEQPSLVVTLSAYLKILWKL